MVEGVRHLDQLVVDEGLAARGPRAGARRRPAGSRGAAGADWARGRCSTRPANCWPSMNGVTIDGPSRRSCSPATLARLPSGDPDRPGPCPAPPEGSVVTIGAYDGVHLGHRAVIAEVRRRAAATTAPAVVTFDRHPASVVRPESAPLLLTDLDQKLELLADTGRGSLPWSTSTRRAAGDGRALRPTRCSSTACAPGSVVVGRGLPLRAPARGQRRSAPRDGRRLGFDVDGLSLVHAGGGPPATGPGGLHRHPPGAGRRRPRASDDLLGRPYQVRGEVVDGDARGRVLAFPTATWRCPRQPPPGRRHLRRLVRVA